MVTAIKSAVSLVTDWRLSISQKVLSIKEKVIKQTGTYAISTQNENILILDTGDCFMQNLIEK